MGFVRRAALLAAAAATTASVLTGCDAGDRGSEVARAGEGSGQAGAAADPVQVTSNVKAGQRGVPVDTLVTVTAADGRIDSVNVSSPAGRVPGKVSPDGTTWTATERLEPGTTYVVRTKASSGQGDPTTSTTRFATQALTLAEQTFASVAPLQGETVGVGMPVIVTFDVPVRDRASMERHMSVTSTPAQPGSWHWLSDTEVHWRPAKYWRAGSDVTVDLDVNGVPAGGGVYGQQDRKLTFHVGDAHVYRVDARSHRMKVFVNGAKVRDFPITTGKEGFTTRSGVKVIIEKFATKRMRSETIGIAQGNPEYYDLDDVQWAMRLTYSGEFIHAAPWSVGSQGYANVSHGCTGMSPADAKWLYDLSRRGDVVEYTGTSRQMTLTNGFGDWNASFPAWKAGSALS